MSAGCNRRGTARLLEQAPPCVFRAADAGLLPAQRRAMESGGGRLEDVGAGRGGVQRLLQRLYGGLGRSYAGKFTRLQFIQT